MVIQAVTAALVVGLLGGWEPVRGNGHVVERTFERSGFEEVGVGHGFRATVEVGAQPSVTVKADENLFEHLEVVVEDGVLRVRVPGGVSLHPSRPVEVRVTLPSLRGVAASGGSKVTASGIRASAFSLTASGGSTVRVSGARAETLELRASGGAEVDVSDLPVRTLSVRASGGSEVEAAVSEKVDGHLSGGSTLDVQGRADTHRVSTSGGSRVRTR